MEQNGGLLTRVERRWFGGEDSKMLFVEISKLSKVVKGKVLPGDNESPSGDNGSPSVCNENLSVTEGRRKDNCVW